ncbi:MAG TPA: DinB family protein [Pyrinomonadaceae bacterium]|jgi:uncharacterized damage-inducible protein DinB|nr:DinB family protein [Pyrinomonadaceae bacterium]
MLEYMLLLFSYDAWANARALGSLNGAQDSKALAPLAHLLVSEEIWFMRLAGEDTSTVNKSPELSLADCENLAEEARQSFEAYLDSLPGENLDVLVTYKNFKGTEFQTSAIDILTHVLMHSAYHRGQTAMTLRGEGHTPADTDYITFVRETASS